jgi:hypothetical protein
LQWWSVNRMNDFKSVDGPELLRKFKFYQEFYDTMDVKFWKSHKYFRKTMINTINNELVRIMKIKGNKTDVK